ncbi:MAG: hypothetical protein ACPG4Y_06820 [Chitinophagales bacterium]
MNYNTFQNILSKSLERQLASWKQKHQNLFQQEHLERLAKTLYAYIHKNERLFYSQPSFNEEIIEDIDLHLSVFKNIKTFHKETLENDLFQAFKKISTASILMILGQRLTPASLRDKNAFPPLKKDLLQASFVAYNHQISKATRAWEKHVGRSQDNFWGTIKGTPEIRELKVKTIVEEILNNVTWWNVYFHYKHELVYEVRVKTGHGLRWKLSNLDLVGFVEPFDDEY